MTSTTSNDKPMSPANDEKLPDDTRSDSTGPQPSISLLFSLLPRRRLFLVTFPAIFFSIISGGIAPYMTLVVGRSFDAFANFPLSNPSRSDKDHLLHSVGLAALELALLAGGALALSSITSSLWIWTGEYNVMALRKRVYDAVTRKDMLWFDTKMGSEGNVQATEGDGPLGAGGFMANFSKETEDVRMASSLAAGFLLQYLTTCIACLVLAFLRSWSLTLVILSAVPLLMIIHGFSQGFAGRQLAVERSELATAGSLVDRAVGAIATVKAFNAAPYERDALSVILMRLRSTVKKINGIWSVASGLAQFVTMGMFVQGFWFGAKLVKEGKVSPGNVMAVFWACLIATSSLQMCIPQFITFAKGKFAAASLWNLVEAPAPQPVSGTRMRKTTSFRKIVPHRCYGELAMQNVTFAYPSRPTMPVLRDVSLFLPARETTFIVGGSGSGKSTIAHLLLRMYDPQAGMIQLDNQDVSYLDDDWMREQIACVSQECILFDMSVRDNVAMGIAGSAGDRQPSDVTIEEVIDACRAGLMHDFVRDLPDGYDTNLGTGGANLSGGQRQRLAISRAKLRNPTVLVLDEATSALDATSRVLVFEAIKRWRQNKTTVVITHDLSQINSNDFVYVLKDGRVAEQGYRYDLETNRGEFRQMMETQGAMGGFVPVEVGTKQEIEFGAEETVFDLRHLSRLRPESRLVPWGNGIFDSVVEYNRSSRGPSRRFSRFILPEAFTAEYLPPPVPPIPHFRSLGNIRTPSNSSLRPMVMNDPDFDVEKMALKKSAHEASRRRPEAPGTRTRWDEARTPPMDAIKVEEPQAEEKPQPFWSLARDLYPTVPYKSLVLLGIVICLLNGAMTPIFSFLLSRLMFEVSIGAENVSTINIFGGIVLGIAAVDGMLIGVKYFVMESAAMCWVTSMRKRSYRLVLAQDKKWFDKSENSPVRLVQIIIKDGDDAGNLVAVVLGQSCVVVAMVGVGLIWALIKGWQLTLVGFAIAPVFVIAMAVETNLVARCELRNKRAREDVSKEYYQAIANVREIRAMAFESVFRSQFHRSADNALRMGLRGAFVEGCTHGVASALIYLAEALLFYTGAVLIARGTYSYLQMVEVLNLVVFTVTIGSQLLAFTQKIAKSLQAARDFNRLLALPTDTEESNGSRRPTLKGAVTLSHVSFSYPERPDVPILKNLSMTLADGECVAVVGASGSGKSTIAALLQRLYEPDSGAIRFGHAELRDMDVRYLREHVAVVSQDPNLFDASISDNIKYGSRRLSEKDIRRAAKAANVHDFIKTLPRGYDTMVGENASLISGGQAQRLQIARALARRSKLLILDECTSSLDSANQTTVLETIQRAKVGRTTVMITHKLAVMRMCDRILVIHGGEVAEHGTYEALMKRKGVFAKLAHAGEWVGE